MTNLIEVSNISQFILIIAFLTIYVLASIIIKPLMLNHKRLISTLILKFSYLIYLASLLLCVYLFIFYGPENIEDQLSEILFISLSTFLFIPNLGIIFRRHFKKYREHYNYFFSVVNLTTTVFIIYKLNQFNWFIF